MTQGEMMGLAQSQANQGSGMGFLAGLLGKHGWVCGDSYAGPDEDGWYEYLGACPAHALCQFKQGKDGVPWVGYADELHPEVNVAYLKWRYTGIANHERGF